MLVAFLPLVIGFTAGWGAAAHDDTWIRLDRALYSLAVAWVFLSARLAAGELLHRWIRRVRIRTKLLVAFGVFAATPALLAFTYAVLAGWIHSGSLRASAIVRQLEDESGGRGVVRRAEVARAPLSGSELTQRFESERAVLDDRGLAGAAWERGSEGWRLAARHGGPDSLFFPAAAPVADSGRVVRGLAYRSGRVWWVETALWPNRGDTLALQTFEPVDTARMNRLARALRCDIALTTSPTMSSGGTSITIGGGRSRGIRSVRAAGGAIEISTDESAAPWDSAAVDSLSSFGDLALVGGGAYAGAKTLREVPGPSNGGAAPRCFLWTGHGWRYGAALLLVRSAPGEIFRFSGLDLGPFATAATIALIVFATFFLGLEIVSLVVGARVARYITRGASSLRAAAASLGRGDFSTRVQVPSEDELGELADSFNQMAAGLEEGQRAMLEREQMRRELELARRIQSRLLPPSPPSLPRLDIAATNAMSQQVGGDYYDFISMEDGRVGLCIADVAGKGVAAALLMSSVKTALVSSAAVETAPDRLTARINRLLEQSIEPGRFVTFFLATLDPRTLHFDYVNAGHPAPMLLRAGGELERLERGGVILGIDAGAVYEAGSATLQPGDMLALFTDGVTEARGVDDELFGDERIESLLRESHRRSAEDVLRGLVDAVKRYEGDRGPSDDVTAIVVKVED
jgi:serine phosphatase RsbU (regulator of sigma subunit)